MVAFILVLCDFFSFWNSIQAFKPTVKPTAKPTHQPTLGPSIKRTSQPIQTIEPTPRPTVKPTVKPTIKPTVKPTTKTTVRPTLSPSGSLQPTYSPTTPNSSFQNFDLVLLAIVIGITLGAIVASAICCCLYVVWYHRTHHIATSVEVLTPTQTHYSPLATSSHEVSVEMIEASKIPSAPPLISPQVVIIDNINTYETI